MSYSLGQAITGQASATSAGVAAADAYTYGATSQALAQGQAMQAWGELAKKQNYPAIKEQAASLTCPAGFLFSPTPKSPYMTCVNQDGVHVAYADNVTCGEDPSHSNVGWWYCTEVVRYLRLHGPFGSPSRAQLTNATMAALRALKMTTGSYGWQNVRSQIRSVAWMISKGGGDVDDIQADLEASIGPYYDKDVAAAKAATPKISTSLIATIASMMKPKTTTAASTSKGASTPPAPTGASAGAAVAVAALTVAAIGGMWAVKHGYHRPALAKLRGLRR